MRAITIKSVEVLDEALQNEIHYTFGMEQYTDYVFKPKEENAYSATIVMENSQTVIENVEKASSTFPNYEFVIEDLDMDSNIVTSYKVKDGEIVDKQFSIS